MDSDTVPIPFPTAPFQGPVDGPLDPERASAYQAILDEVPLSGHPGGVTAAVVHPAEGMWTGAGGSADGVVPMTPEHQLSIGWLTQPVTAAAVMRLVEEGDVDLDTAAAEYLSPDIAEYTGPVTVRQLLSMRSGIPDLYASGMNRRLREDRGRVWTPAEVLDVVGERSAPGEPNYSATNSMLLGLVVEGATGASLAQAMRAGVMSGPALDRMIVQPQERPTEPLAAPFVAGLDAATVLEQGRGYLPSLAEITAAGGASSIASDVASLARWWTGFCGGEVVSRTVLNVMTRDGLGVGDGTDVVDRPSVGWSSMGNGNAAFAACLPHEGTVVVVLGNMGPLVIEDVAHGLVDVG